MILNIFEIKSKLTGSKVFTFYWPECDMIRIKLIPKIGLEDYRIALESSFAMRKEAFFEAFLKKIVLKRFSIKLIFKEWIISLWREQFVN